MNTQGKGVNSEVENEEKELDTCGGPARGAVLLQQDCGHLKVNELRVRRRRKLPCPSGRVVSESP
eukprot:510180-Prorocentrum_minimum.AAC.1